MRSSLLFALLGAALLGACASGPERSPAVLREIDALGEGLARTLCPGPPTAVESVANRHVSGQTDRIETRECVAGRATLYRGATTSDPDGLALAVEVRERGAGLPAYVEIGHPLRSPRRVLGAPQARTTSSVTYALDEEGNGTLTIRHAEGRVASVQWTWLVD